MTESTANPAGQRAAAWAGNERVRRYVPLFAWLVVITTVLWMPMKIIGLGYLPPDDALRHAAQGVSGKPWGDVMVLREPIKVDFQFGWDMIQRLMHRALNADAEALVEISVIGLFVVLSACMLVWLRRPEAWLGAFLLSEVAGSPCSRFFYGRPYMLTVSVLLILLMAWRTIGSRGPRARDFAWITALIGAACFIHGTWYLWLLPVVAFALARQFRWAAVVGGGWLLGALLAGLATGHPVDYLAGAVDIALRCVGSFSTKGLMAGELQPLINFTVFFAFGALLALRQLVKAPWRPLASDPALWLFMMAWVLGTSTGRFWYDWGMPALLVLFVDHVQTLLEFGMAGHALKRVVWVVGICGAAYATTTADTSGRWTAALHVEYLTEDDPQLAGWMPEPGGIIYATSMGVFYNTYFKNPNAPWKYDLGFEPTLMPDDDFRIYHRVVWNYGDDATVEPWVKKMRTQDRLILSMGQPHIPELEWKHAAGTYWIGRLPRTNAPPVVEPKAK